jgi:hypothetical protein
MIVHSRVQLCRNSYPEIREMDFGLRAIKFGRPLANSEKSASTLILPRDSELTLSKSLSRT